MSFFKTFSTTLGQVLAHYGGWGLFTISFLDSSFLSFPVVNDLLLLHLSARHPSRALVYALDCAIGSVLGAAMIYALGRRGGKSLWGKSSAEKMKRVERWLERNDILSVVVASLLPPPAPFKLFAVAAGMLRVSPGRFAAALLVGRTLRFTAEGWMGAQYGERAEAYLKENMGWASLLTAALLLGITLFYRRFRGRPQEEPPGAPGSGSV